MLATAASGMKSKKSVMIVFFIFSLLTTLLWLAAFGVVLWVWPK
jgi:hypothetical protein